MNGRFERIAWSVADKTTLGQSDELCDREKNNSETYDEPLFHHPSFSG